MKQRQPAQPERLIGFEHIAGKSENLIAGNQAGKELDIPYQLQQEHRDCLHARQQRTFLPESRQPNKQSKVGEPKKICRTVLPPIRRHENAYEKGVEKTDRVWNGTRKEFT